MSYLNGDRTDVVVIGGGLAGLTAAAYLARAGRQVTVFEKGRKPGGRARTRERDGYLFNLGPHALFAGGPGADVLRDLGVAFAGHTPPPKRIQLEHQGTLYGLPGDVATLLKTRLLSIGEKVELSRLMMRMPNVDPETVAGLTTRQWVEQLTSTPRLQQLLVTLIRAASYSVAIDHLSAAVALGQLQLILGENVRYLDGGWRTLVDGLRQVVEDEGGLVESSRRVANVAEDGDGVWVRLVDGRRVRASAAVLAVSPRAAARLVPDNSSLHAAAMAAVPVRFASLDIALRRLPRPDRAVVFGMERPLYLSVHSEFGRLAPEEAAVVHLGRYLDTGEAGDDESQKEMLGLMDRVQPGWRDEVVTRRYMRQNTVVNWLPGPGGLRTRPGVRVPGSDRLFLAGDWVGATGWLADGSFASGREAADLILQVVQQERFELVYA
jgi:phytoene dehydrogenase-like protein